MGGDTITGSLKTYYQLTKPGIIRGNAFTAAAGYFLAAKGHFDAWLFLAMLGGISFVIASACVVNNLIDRDIDTRMARTKQRGLVTGAVRPRVAAVYAVVLGLIGFGLLAAFTNWVAVAVAALGYFFYVVMYSLWWKRGSVHGTLVGSVSGAVPPVVGYTAVSGRIDVAAILLFLILTTWQMPHFYSIAIYRLKDYTAAKVPVMPIVLGVRTTKYYIVGYIIAFIFVAALLGFTGYTGKVYLAVLAILGFSWLRLAFHGFRAKDNTKWAGRLFGFSLLTLTILSITISLDAFLP